MLLFSHTLQKVFLRLFCLGDSVSNDLTSLGYFYMALPAMKRCVQGMKTTFVLFRGQVWGKQSQPADQGGENQSNLFCHWFSLIFLLQSHLSDGVGTVVLLGCPPFSPVCYTSVLAEIPSPGLVMWQLSLQLTAGLSLGVCCWQKSFSPSAFRHRVLRHGDIAAPLLVPEVPSVSLQRAGHLLKPQLGMESQALRGRTQPRRCLLDSLHICIF